MSKILAIFGSAHLGQQIAQYAICDNHYEQVVFFDDYTSKKNVAGFNVIGNSHDILKQFQKNSFDEIIIGIGYKHLQFKHEMYLKLKDVIPFGKIIHSSCWVDKTARISPGVVIYPCCTIDSDVVIDSNCVINLQSCIAHDSVIGSCSFLAPGVIVSGFTSIGNNCFIGAGATLIDNISIGDNIRIGAGAVVTRNISVEGLYAGVPAKVIK
jgi:sugar O-acyltransferase (sialic acid O-acetyltransferase NeuD family)